MNVLRSVSIVVLVIALLGGGLQHFRSFVENVGREELQRTGPDSKSQNANRKSENISKRDDFWSKSLVVSEPMYTTDPIEEKLDDLKNYVESGSSDVLINLLQEIKSRDVGPRNLFLYRLYTGLSKASLEEPRKFQWIFENFDKISMVLNEYSGSGVGRFAFGAKLSQEIYWNLKKLEIDWVDELEYLPSGDCKMEMRDWLLPYAMVDDLDSHVYLYDELTEESRSVVEQSLMEISSLNNKNQFFALGLYLDQGGEKGVQKEVVDGWFVNDEWVISHASELSIMIENASSGPRKDLVLGKISLSLCDEFPDESMLWLGEIEDAEYAKVVKAEMMKRR
ncbi:hypothetical protein [Roseibacillus ishigakijimensis]|uniref:Uncharacterized protein n=1 Tax=Roseibacillus ishigakijimensis TaxID=454146 RepID=A0A934VLR5_9BACT|nr:hypothetical protein [Roseibacillus ishigakijimensis]MBK1833522.1 hypothetical protein [Roseibacillus ishigakijimensis]